MKSPASFRLFALFRMSSVLLLFSVSAALAVEKNSSGLLWPLDPVRGLTSQFAEYRPSRFHAGIDFSIAQEIGAKCYAIGDGDVVRIKVDFLGYGKALYYQLADGTIAVYAHLDRFAPALEEEVKRLQLEKGSYEVEEMIEPGRFPFKQGDVICYAGNSGAGPAHLHFELRHGMAVPFNPDLLGYRLDDTSPPILSAVAIRPMDGNSEVDGDMKPVAKNVSSSSAQPVSFYGNVGLAVKAHDKADYTWYRVGPRSFELWIDGILRHTTALDSFPYAENRMARLDFDYELEREGFKGYRRLYRTTPNRLSFYRDTLPGGILDSRVLGPGRHTAEIRVYDTNGNVSRATWILNALDAPTLPPGSGIGPSPRGTARPMVEGKVVIDLEITGPTPTLLVTLMGVPANVVHASFTISSIENEFGTIHRKNGRWTGRAILPPTLASPAEIVAYLTDEVGEVHRTSRTVNLAGISRATGGTVVSGDSLFRVEFDPADLWYDLGAMVTEQSRDSETVLKRYRVDPGDYPLAGPCKLTFRTPASLDSRAVVVYRSGSGDRWSYLGNSRALDRQSLSAMALSFEEFSVVLDTLPPSISNPGPAEGASLDRKPRFYAGLSDDLSGLDLSRCKLLIDSENTIWFFDSDAKTISFRPWTSLEPGSHSWEILAVDRAGNEQRLRRTFRVR